jgi:phosphoribosylaminoimidazolecarboxamide formyltransferase / IMP cyclohydrolase
MGKIRTAIISVTDKTGIVWFAKSLSGFGVQILSTGGTAKTLREGGVSVTDISAYTGFPEMMDGRVKTLHPALHAGILARRDQPGDLAALDAHELSPVDVVVVNLYPFVEAAAKPDLPFDALVEEIDIGGPSLVRAAAKNFRSVFVVVDPADYPRLLDALDHPTLAFRFELMRKAVAHTAAYDAAISSTLAEISEVDGRFERRPGGPLGERLHVSARKLRDLRYGENPHQHAAWYAAAAGGLGGASVLQGKELSYTNLLDLDAAARIALEFDEPAAVVIKHTNPCGAATGDSTADAYVRARDADSLSAYGGIVALNRSLDAATAGAIVSTFIEAVIAPSVDDDARETLARRRNMRVVTADFSGQARGGVELRSILGALLAQERDVVSEAHTPWRARSLPEGVRVVTQRAPTDDEWEALRFAWRVCAHVKSNTVIFTDRRRTLAIGAGQMSRVDAVNVAVMKARSAERSLAGSVAASDAYFPFRDGLDAVAAAGATAVVQPGGSVRDPEVIAAANEQGIAMVFTGKRHFRH